MYQVGINKGILYDIINLHIPFAVQKLATFLWMRCEYTTEREGKSGVTFYWRVTA
jgi:hypothetical protein